MRIKVTALFSLLMMFGHFITKAQTNEKTILMDCRKGQVKVDLLVKSDFLKYFYIKGTLCSDNESIIFQPSQDTHIFKKLIIKSEEIQKKKGSEKVLKIRTITRTYKFRLSE